MKIVEISSNIAILNIPWRQKPYHILRGIKYHIPPCCILRFIFDNRNLLDESRPVCSNKFGNFAGCGVFHK